MVRPDAAGGPGLPGPAAAWTLALDAGPGRRPELDAFAFLRHGSCTRKRETWAAWPGGFVLAASRLEEPERQVDNPACQPRRDWTSWTPGRWPTPVPRRTHQATRPTPPLRCRRWTWQRPGRRPRSGPMVQRCNCCGAGPSEPTVKGYRSVIAGGDGAGLRGTHQYAAASSVSFQPRRVQPAACALAAPGLPTPGFSSSVNPTCRRRVTRRRAPHDPPIAAEGAAAASWWPVGIPDSSLVDVQRRRRRRGRWPPMTPGAGQVGGSFRRKLDAGAWTLARRYCEAARRPPTFRPRDYPGQLPDWESPAAGRRVDAYPRGVGDPLTPMDAARNLARRQKFSGPELAGGPGDQVGAASTAAFRYLLQQKGLLLQLRRRRSATVRTSRWTPRRLRFRSLFEGARLRPVGFPTGATSDPRRRRSLRPLELARFCLDVPPGAGRRPGRPPRSLPIHVGLTWT